PFATFNVADACLTVGVIMLIVLFAVDMIKHPTDDLEVDPRLVEEAKAELAKEQGENASAESEESAENEPSEEESKEE
ncbi:MAG: hypothetical protein K6F32_04675, partial [Bacilli bacterium]|nr:hypothetical protein [Bacilli bacterium]